MGVVRPAGPLPARVYWVRRAVVLGVPLLLVALVVWLVVGRGAADARADEPTPAPTGTTTAPDTTADDTGAEETDDEADDGKPPECTPEVLALSVAATAESFPEGASPTFVLSITNTGTDPCLVDAGEAHREVVITSGVDRVWSSRDCVAAGTESRTLLLAGGAVEEAQLGWDRVRSAQGCPADQPAPGAGTYSVAFTLAGATATPAVFGLG